MLQRILIALLLLGACVNLAAGARRPLVERAILGANHYAQADAAAEAVRRLVPGGAPLAVVVYDGDMVDELDAAIWFDYRSKWLLYPRRIEVFRVAPGDPLRLRPVPGMAAPPTSHAEYLQRPYLLFFRVTAPPSLPGGVTPAAEGPMWALARGAEE